MRAAGQRQAAAKNALRLAGAAMATTASGSHNLHTAGAVLAAVPTTPDKKSIGAPAAVPTDTGSNVAKRGFHLESAARYHSHKPPSPARPSPEITSGEDAFCNIETDRYPAAPRNPHHTLPLNLPPTCLSLCPPTSARPPETPTNAFPSWWAQSQSSISISCQYDTPTLPLTRLSISRTGTTCLAWPTASAGGPSTGSTRRSSPGN